MRCERWQPFENLFLHEVGEKMPLPEIAAKLERSESAITRQASRISDPIPELRQVAMPGCQTCADCQGVIELHRRLRGK